MFYILRWKIKHIPIIFHNICIISCKYVNMQARTFNNISYISVQYKNQSCTTTLKLFSEDDELVLFDSNIRIKIDHLYTNIVSFQLTINCIKFVFLFKCINVPFLEKVQAFCSMLLWAQDAWIFWQLWRQSIVTNALGA